MWCRPQDTVYSIAWRYGLDFRDLARWNNIGPDFHIAVGQALILAPSRSRQHARAARSRHPLEVAGRASAEPLTGPRVGLAYGSMSAHRARCPSGGILLSGQLGQDVRAASAGRVVYTGSGIRGYGNLIIIKHGENLLSAYAHNRESLVHDGQEVVARRGDRAHGRGSAGKSLCCISRFAATANRSIR